MFVVMVAVALLVVGVCAEGLCIFNYFSYIFHLYLNLYQVSANGALEAALEELRKGENKFFQ